MSLKVLRSLWSHMRFLFGVPHWIIIDMNVRQLAPKTIRPGWLAPNSQLLVDWKCTISHQDMNNMKAFARLHWWFFCGKTLSTTYSMLLWKLFGLFSLGGNEDCAEIRAGSLSRRAARFRECSVLHLSKGLISYQKQIYIWLFCSSNTLHLRSHISDCISTEPTNLSFAFTSNLSVYGIANVEAEDS